MVTSFIWSGWKNDFELILPKAPSYSSTLGPACSSSKQIELARNHSRGLNGTQYTRSDYMLVDLVVPTLRRFANCHLDSEPSQDIEYRLLQSPNAMSLSSYEDQRRYSGIWLRSDQTSPTAWHISRNVRAPVFEQCKFNSLMTIPLPP